MDFNTLNDITGGTLSVASAQTNSQGQAQTVYTAGSTASSSNGVVVQATVQGTSFTSQTSLTVGGQTLNLTFGNTSLLVLLPSGCVSSGTITPPQVACTQYGDPFSVLAVDSAGNPVAGAVFTLTVKALYYYKGSYTLNGPSSTATAWIQNNNVAFVVGGQQCPNEDGTSPVAAARYNGLLDPGEDGCGPAIYANQIAESLPSSNPLGYACNAYGNQNNQLDPGVTAVTSPSTVTTDSTGTASFLVIYPQSEETWVNVQLTAATTVSGSQSSKSVTFTLPALATDLTTTKISPPGLNSPYGTAAVCANPN